MKTSQAALWRAYKTLMPKATTSLGFDLGFLFEKDSGFEEGVIAFNAAHPSHTTITDYLRLQRAEWQQRLKAFRNEFIEHRSADRDQFADYYKPETAEFPIHAPSVAGRSQLLHKSRRWTSHTAVHDQSFSSSFAPTCSRVIE